MDFTNLAHPLINIRAQFCALLLSGFLPATAFAQMIPIDLEKQLNDLALKVSTQNIGPELMVAVQNEETFDVQCTARFDNGPQIPVERRAIIKAGKHGQLTAPVRRAVTRVSIQLNCQRQPSK